MRLKLFISATALLLVQVSWADLKFNTSSYNIIFPDGWERISDQDLRKSQALVGGNSNVTYQAGFQISGKPAFGLPFAVIQMIPYPSGRQPSLDELKAELTQIGNSDPISSLSPQGKKFVDSISQSDVTFDDSKLSYTFTLMSQGKGNGPVRTTCVGFLERSGIVQIGFNCLQQDYNQYHPTFDSILASFRVVPSERFDTTVHGRAPSSIWDGVAEKAIGGAVTGLIFGTVMVLRQRFEKKKNI